jgi:hypothetical protein
VVAHEQSEAVRRLVLFAVLLLSMLTCRKWDNPLDPTDNHAPWVPSNPRPRDSGFSTGAGLVLSWQSHDPDEGDVAYFAVAFGTDSSLPVFEENGFDTTFRPTGVVCSTQYYWRVKAYDDFDTVLGPVWRFQTVPALAVTAPDSGDKLETYTTDTIKWTGGPSGAECATGASPVVFTADGAGRRGLDAAAVLAGPDSVVVSRSTDDGVSWVRLGPATTPGQYIWQVPAPPTEYARVRVQVFALTDTMTGTSGRFVIRDTITRTEAAVGDHGTVSVRGLREK